MKERGVHAFRIFKIECLRRGNGSARESDGGQKD
jgi:hypothetical protein